MAENINASSVSEAVQFIFKGLCPILSHAARRLFPPDNPLFDHILLPRYRALPPSYGVATKYFSSVTSVSFVVMYFVYHTFKFPPFVVSSFWKQMQSFSVLIPPLMQFLNFPFSLRHLHLAQWLQHDFFFSASMSSTQS